MFNFFRPRRPETLGIQKPQTPRIILSPTIADIVRLGIQTQHGVAPDLPDDRGPLGWILHFNEIANIDPAKVAPELGGTVLGALREERARIMSVGAPYFGEYSLSVVMQQDVVAALEPGVKAWNEVASAFPKAPEASYYLKESLQPLADDVVRHLGPITV